jgi:hypothetical protein
LIALTRCRELLEDTGSEISDTQVELLSGQLYALADVVTDMFIQHHETGKLEVANDEARPEWN